MWYSHTMDYYQVIKNEIPMYATTKKMIPSGGPQRDQELGTPERLPSGMVRGN